MTKDAIYMEYTETNSYTLTADKVPTHKTGDKIYIYVQTFDQTGVGDSTEAKAQYLNAGPFLGSDWTTGVGALFA